MPGVGNGEPHEIAAACARISGSKVLLLIVGHLASAPRAQKEAAALRAAGAQVMIRGNWHDSVLAEEDIALARALDVDFAAVSDLRRDGAGSLGDRIRHRAAREAFIRFGMVTPRVHGPGAPELLRAARRIGADLTMVRSEPGLWVGRQLLAEGRRIGVDFEDWFSQDQLPEDRNIRARTVLQELERHLLRHAHCCVTTTRALADALALDAATTRVPTVVPNCFPAALDAAAGPAVRMSEAVPEGVVSFYWVSQTIGPGRGLEALARALPLLQGNWRLTLRGALHGHRDWFEQTFPESLRTRIRCLEPVPNAELPLRTAAHDVGLALEIPYCPNKELTASNKLFEYLRAGLAVIATGTRGQDEIMRACPGAGMVVAPGDPAALAQSMQAMLDDPIGLLRVREQARRAGREVWNWERHAPALLSALASGLGAPSE